MHRISFPFLYLDSSALLRSEFDPKVLTRKTIQNDKNERPFLIEKITSLSNQEDIYYKNNLYRNYKFHYIKFPIPLLE